MKFKNKIAREAYDKLMAELKDTAEMLNSFMNKDDVENMFVVAATVAKHTIDGMAAVLKTCVEIDNQTSQANAAIASIGISTQSLCESDKK